MDGISWALQLHTVFRAKTTITNIPVAITEVFFHKMKFIPVSILAQLMKLQFVLCLHVDLNQKHSYHSGASVW